MALKGRFFPQNPAKYAGDPTNIVFRSAWERTFMEYCDRQSNILRWSSEETIVPYYFQGDGKWHRYFPDFVLTVRTKDQKVETWMVEIKPHKQTMHPSIAAGRPGYKNKKTGRRQLREAVEYAKNQAKWDAASTYCRTRGWKFMVITEKELYPNG